MSALASLWRRLFGRSCGPKRPSSKDIFNELRERGRQVDEQTAAFRRAQVQGVPDALYPPLRNGGRRR